MRSPGKNKPAGIAIPYSTAQKINQSRKNAIAIYTLNPDPSEKLVRKNLTEFPSDVIKRDARGF